MGRIVPLQCPQKPRFTHLRDFSDSFGSSTLAIGLHGKPQLFGFLGYPLDFLRVGRLHQHAKSPRRLYGPRSASYSCARVGGQDTVPQEQLSDSGDRARSHGLALSGRCELRRRGRIAGCVEPSQDSLSRSGGTVSDTIQLIQMAKAERRNCLENSQRGSQTCILVARGAGSMLLCPLLAPLGSPMWDPTRFSKQFLHVLR